MNERGTGRGIGGRETWNKHGGSVWVGGCGGSSAVATPFEE